MSWTVNSYSGKFLHRAIWNEAESAVEMHLMSLVSQSVKVAGAQFRFAAGETIHTESSRKYDFPASRSSR